MKEQRLNAVIVNLKGKVSCCKILHRERCDKNLHSSRSRDSTDVFIVLEHWQTKYCILRSNVSYLKTVVFIIKRKWTQL